MKPLWTHQDSRKFEVFASALIAACFVGAATVLYSPRLQGTSGDSGVAATYASYCWMNAKKLMR